MSDQRELLRSLDQLYQTAHEDGRQEIARKWKEALDMLEEALVQYERIRTAMDQVKSLVAGDRVPNWKDDWQTTHTRGLILDIIDGVATPSQTRGTPNG